MAKVKRVHVDEFAEAVQSVIDEFGIYIDSTVMKQAVKQTAEDTVWAVKAGAPVNTGKYSASITHGEKENRKHRYVETVYAESPSYRLTHLLEKGHATRNGGRTRAFPHWSTGEEGIAEMLKKRLTEALL